MSDTPEMDAVLNEPDDVVFATGCKLERELNQALRKIKELETAAWVAAEKAKADAYEDAARLIEKLAEDYTHEHGSYDPSTNAWELHHRHAERIEALDDAVAAIRERKAKVCQVTQAIPRPRPSLPE